MSLRYAVLAVWLLGCGQVSRVSECQRFVSVANPALEQLRALDAPNHVVPAADNYERLAVGFERFVADIDGLRVRDRRLGEAVASIRTTMKSAADDCREYARELREHDQMNGDTQRTGQLNIRRKLKKTRTRVAASVRLYQAQVERVNTFCQPQ